MEDLSWMTSDPRYGADYHDGGQAQDGDPEQDIPRTPIHARLFNVLMNELVNVVQGAGLTLDSNNSSQVLAAIRLMTVGLGTQDLPKIQNFAHVHQLVTGFYWWDAGTGNTPVTVPADTPPYIALIINHDDGVHESNAHIIAMRDEAVYTAQCSETPGLSSWQAYWGSSAWANTGSLATTGHQELPSGLILQWGSTGLTSLSDGQFGPFSFDITFPNGRPFYVGAIIEEPSGTGSSGELELYVHGITASQFEIRIDQDISNSNDVEDVRWFAVGY